MSPSLKVNKVVLSLMSLLSLRLRKGHLGFKLLRIICQYTYMQVILRPPPVGWLATPFIRLSPGWRRDLYDTYMRIPRLETRFIWYLYDTPPVGDVTHTPNNSISICLHNGDDPWTRYYYNVSNLQTLEIRPCVPSQKKEYTNKLLLSNDTIFSAIRITVHIEICHNSRQISMWTIILMAEKIV